MNNNLKVVWYNVRGVKGKLNDIVAMMEKCKDITVLFLQETNNTDMKWRNKITRHLGYIGCELLFNEEAPKVAAIVRRISEVSLVQTNYTERCQLLELVGRNMRFIVCNHYGPHKKTSSYYRELREFINEIMNMDYQLSLVEIITR